MILTLVALTMREKVDLVAPDYYAQELKYQERIDQINRSQKFNEPLNWEVEEEGIRFLFPQEVQGAGVAGKVVFFRPSDSDKDLSKPLKVNARGEAFLSFDGLSAGAYTMQVSWHTGDSAYYNEGFIQIP
jgi:hypothetical protein